MYCILEFLACLTFVFLRKKSLRQNQIIDADVHRKAAHFIRNADQPDAFFIHKMQYMCHFIYFPQRNQICFLRNAVESKQIGNMVMDRLKEVDEVAYVRFASVYRQFKDINTFIDELEKLLVEKKKG